MRINGTSSSIQKQRLLRKAMINANLKSSSKSGSRNLRNSLINAMNGNNTKTSKYITKNTALLKNNYFTLKNVANSLQNHASNLMASGDTSLFGQAIQVKKAADNSKETSDTNTSKENTTKSSNQKELTEVELAKGKDHVVKEINAFIDDYNTMMKKMASIDDRTNNVYIKQLKGYVKHYDTALKELGITQASDGTLLVDQKTLKEADVEKMQTLFQTKNGFADLVATRSSVVESNANMNLTKQNKFSYMYNYNRNGSSYNNYGTSGSRYNTRG